MARVKRAYKGWNKLNEGQNIHKGDIERLKVGPNEKVTVYDGANIHDKQDSVVFLAGEYQDIWTHGKWLHSDGSKLIGVEHTGFAPRELLEFVWYQRARNGSNKKAVKRFEPGEYDANKRDFPNDIFQQIIVPGNAVVEVFDGSNQSGGHVPFSKGSFKLDDYDLNKRVSSFVYKLDEWKQISTRLGDVRNKRDIGQPVIASFEGTGTPGTQVECPVSLGQEDSNEKNWYASASITESVTVKVGGEAAPVSAEFGLSSTQEAGGGGVKVHASSQEAGIVVTAIADKNGIVKGSIIAQRYEANHQIFRKLENIRTGEITEQEGELLAQRYDFKFDFTNGNGVKSED